MAFYMHILFCSNHFVQYNTRLWPHSESDDHPEETERSETRAQGSIKRRYREFMELHHRLLCGSFASLMKGTKKFNLLTNFVYTG
jgi:hypothetical protein